jgi:hypothetical protein
MPALTGAQILPSAQLQWIMFAFEVYAQEDPGKLLLASHESLALPLTTPLSPTLLDQIAANLLQKAQSDWPELRERSLRLTWRFWQQLEILTVNPKPGEA